MEPAYRLRKGGREYPIRHPGTLIELASRRLLEPGDPVWVGADGRWVTARDIEALKGCFDPSPSAPPGPAPSAPPPPAPDGAPTGHAVTDGPRSPDAPASPPPDPWSLWEAGAPAGALDDLVAGFQAPAKGARAVAPPVTEPSVPSSTAPRSASGTALPVAETGATARPAVVEPPPAPRTPPPATEPVPPTGVPGPSGPPLPRSAATPSTSRPPATGEPPRFADWLAGRAGRPPTPLRIRPDGPPTVFVSEPPRPAVRPAVWVLGAVMAVAAAAGVTWVRTGANQEIPIERAAAEPTPVAPPPGTVPGVEPALPTPAAPPPGVPARATADNVHTVEQSLRAALPKQIRRFRGAEGLQDVLYQDLLNTGVRVRTLAVQRVGSNGGRAGPLTVRIDVELDGSKPESVPNQVALVALVVGTYMDQSSVAVRELGVSAVDPQGGARLTWPLTGDAVARFHGRKVDLGRFLESLL